jgi:hypothetical protein
VRLGWFGSGAAAAGLAVLLAGAPAAQPLNTAPPEDAVPHPVQPLGDAEAEPDTPPAPDDGTAQAGRYGVEWAEHVSPSFRRWVAGDRSPSRPDADPAIRNRPDPERGAVENALDRTPQEPVAVAGAGATARFLKRVSRGHARYLVGPEGAIMGAELADGIQMTPLSRSRTRGTLFDRALPDSGAAPRLAEGPLPGAGPLQEMPPEPVADAGPVLGEGAAEAPREKGYTVALDKGDAVGVALGEHVDVVHISRFAKGEVPPSGQVAVYPRSRFRPWGPINSFEHLDPFLAVNVEPLRTGEDPSDPALVERSAYAIGNWDLPGTVPLPLSDKSLYEFRQMLIDSQSPRRCCGPTRVSVMHDPLSLIVHPNNLGHAPGQVPAIIPLAPGMPVW